jgi:hypothetical protein
LTLDIISSIRGGSAIASCCNTILMDAMCRWAVRVDEEQCWPLTLFSIEIFQSALWALKKQIHIKINHKWLFHRWIVIWIASSKNWPIESWVKAKSVADIDQLLEIQISNCAPQRSNTPKLYRRNRRIHKAHPSSKRGKWIVESFRKTKWRYVYGYYWHWLPENDPTLKDAVVNQIEKVNNWTLDIERFKIQVRIRTSNEICRMESRKSLNCKSELTRRLVFGR